MIDQKSQSTRKREFAKYREEYQRNGVVYLPGLLDEKFMTLVEEAVQYTIDHPTKFAYERPAAGPFIYSDNGNVDAWSKEPYKTLLNTGPFGEVSQGLFDADDVWFVNEQVFWKEGNYLQRTPWHQDASYFNFDGADQAFFWIALTSLPRENALEFVRGSNHGTLYNGYAQGATKSAPQDGDPTKPLFDDPDRPPLPNIEANRSQYDIISWPIERGDVLVFHPRTLHGGAPDQPGRSRKSLSLRFCGAKTVRRPTLEGEMAAGPGDHGLWGGVEKLEIGAPVSLTKEALKVRSAL